MGLISTLSQPQVVAVSAIWIAWIVSSLIGKRYNPLSRTGTNPHKLPLPPGPVGYPIVGSLLEFPTYKPWLTYVEWFKKYNSDIIYFEVLGQPFLILNSLKRVNDIFEKRSTNYSDRVRMPMIVELMGWGFNFALLRYGDWWRRHRRIFHEHFRPNAVEHYQPILQQEAHAMMRRILDAPKKFADHSRHAFAAMIMKVAYGLDVRESDDPYIRTAEEALSGFAEAGVPGRFLVDLLPALKYVPDWFPGAEFKRKARHWSKINREVEMKPFDQVKKNMENGFATPSILTRLIENLPPEDDPRREEEEAIARHVVAVAYAAGADTTLAVVQAIFLAMAMYPAVQNKAQQQIDTVVGPDRLPGYNDRPSLPYINAMVKEAMRWQVVLPLGVGHMATNDDEYDGYFIPKGTIVMGSTWELLRDPEVFENPDEFIPERYLTPDGQLNPNVRDPDVGAFGYGRRICPGRYMSDNSLYIILVSLLAAYDIKPPLDEAGNEIKLTRKLTSGLMSYPIPFKCRIVPRSSAAKALIRQSGELD